MPLGEDCMRLHSRLLSHLCAAFNGLAGCWCSRAAVSYSTINGTQSSDFNIYCVLRDALRTVAFGAQKWAALACCLLPIACCMLPAACQLPINLRQLGFLCANYLMSAALMRATEIGLLAIFGQSVFCLLFQLTKLLRFWP